MKPMRVGLLILLAILASSLTPEESLASQHCVKFDPSNQSPSNGSVVNTVTPTLSLNPNFNPFGPQQCAVEHVVWQVSSSASLLADNIVDVVALVNPNPLSVIISSTWNGRLSNGDTYYWRAQYLFEDGSLSAWSEIWSFTVVALDLEIDPPCNWRSIANTAPGNQAMNVALNAILRIEIGPPVTLPCDHDILQWQVATDANFVDLVLDASHFGDVLEFQLVEGNMDFNANYYWRARFKTASGDTGDWSAVTQFTTRGTGTQQPPGANLPPQQPPQPPPSDSGDLADLDANGNCSLDDSEFFVAVDAWIGGTMSDINFFAAVDAWIGQSDICVFSASGIRVQAGAQRITFTLTSGDRLGSLVIYDVAGREVARLHGSSNLTLWNLRNIHGQRLANGIYFASVGTTGELTRFYVMF